MKNSAITGHIAGVMYPFCLVFGLYVVLHGHLTPGGGFQGGAVMATGAALMVVSGMFTAGDRSAKMKHYKRLEAAGLAAFTLAAFLGLWAGGVFFQNSLACGGGLFGAAAESEGLGTGGTVPLMNWAVGVEVFGGISVILLTMLKAAKELRGEDDGCGEGTAGGEKEEGA